MNLILFERDEIDSPLDLHDHRARHILDILRLGIGDRIRVGIVNGPQGRAQIRRIEDNALVLECEQALQNSLQSTFEPNDATGQSHPIRCLVGHPRPPVMRRLLKDLTSLGVRHIIVCATELGERSYLQSRLWKDGMWRSCLIEGAMQAGSTWLPRVDIGHSLGDALAVVNSTPIVNRHASEIRILFDPIEERRGISSLDLVPGFGSLIAIGAERGWSEKERRMLLAARFVGYSLGHRILRTETATIAAVAIILAKMGCA